jgi:8-oxo-dGTP pyrophosphatase MutT (NUDIX family)
MGGGDGVKLERSAEPPFELLGSQEVARRASIALRSDRVRWPDGEEGEHRVVESPDSVFMVTFDGRGGTVLVRQWRQAWGTSAWEVPAGTLERGEEPLAGAQRELQEEAGLIASEWRPLGFTRGTALITGRQHHFLALGLSRVQRAPETYERDMVLRELSFDEALEAALDGSIEHAGTIAALVRAARALGKL